MEGSVQGSTSHEEWVTLPLRQWSRTELVREVERLRGALESALYLAEDAWPTEARTMRARFLPDEADDV